MKPPGSSDAAMDSAILDRADNEAEELLDLLKKKVTTETKDVGTLRKELRITVPGDVISERLEHDYNELRSDASVPGFRKGHVPIQLIQKRFSSDVRKSLKTAIIGQSFFAALENEDFKALGDPLFQIETPDGARLVELDEALSHFELPSEGEFKYTCEVEVKPEIELPELKGIVIRSPAIEIGDDMIDEHILRQRKIGGRFEPLDGGAADVDDMVIADVKLVVDGETINEEDNVQLGVRATRLDGIPLLTLKKELSGVNVGDTRSVKCEVPTDYVRPDLRGKEGAFEFVIHEIKRLTPTAMDAYIEQMGCENEKELRTAIAQEIEAERDRLMARARKEQVLGYLLDNIKLDVPEGLSARQTDRAVMRRVVQLQQEGVPEDEVEAKIDELRTTAHDQVVRDLKLEFIMEKVAEKLEVQVTEEELNTEIAMLARMYNKRFDRVRDDLAQRGLLQQLAEHIRQDKCAQIMLADAKITEVPAEKPKPKKAATKKTAKKAAKSAKKKE
jgi:trigger factor